MRHMTYLSIDVYQMIFEKPLCYSVNVRLARRMFYKFGELNIADDIDLVVLANACAFSDKEFKDLMVNGMYIEISRRYNDKISVLDAFITYCNADDLTRIIALDIDNEEKVYCLKHLISIAKYESKQIELVKKYAELAVYAIVRYKFDDYSSW